MNHYNKNNLSSFWEHKKAKETKGKFYTKDASIENRFDFGEDEEFVVRNIKWKRNDRF